MNQNQHLILFYLNNNYPDDISSGNWYYTGTYGEYIDSNKVKEGINNKGGTVFLLNYPILPETSPILDLVKDCKLEKSFSDKGINLGYVYKC